ncbi:hypothetical protein V6N11_044126 [Hibiscus sabdariffa]|uniref:Uncharacterized protein n=1 Tax=Hibiscus sabdariffa TaxID=183260 RepID=A0ABR2REY8_9ROSI
MLAETSGCNSSFAPACELPGCTTEPARCVDPVVAGPSVEQLPTAHFESSPCGLSDHTLRSNANVQVIDSINAPIDMGHATQSYSSGESVAPQTVLPCNASHSRAALLLNTFEINNMSIEALAMAGLDYQVCGIEFHVWEDRPPPYLLADSNSGHEVEKTMSSSGSRGSNKFSVNQVLVKVEMVELVQIIATMNQMALRNYRCIRLTEYIILRNKKGL